MFGNLELAQLQQLWWIIASLVGSLFIFMTFVQGGQALIFTMAENDTEKSMIVNSLGRKWELTFTTLVLFGGALFAAFPLFYATSFGGAYWVWILILFTFIVQAVSYEFRKKPKNLLGTNTYDFFLLVNGTAGLLLIGAAVGTFFTGANFQLNDYNLVTWQHPGRGLEAALTPFNLSMGLFLVFIARSLGAMYLLNNLDLSAPAEMQDMDKRLRRAALTGLIFALPFLLYILAKMMLMDGFALDPETGRVFMEKAKYFNNIMAMPVVLGLLLAGLVLVVWGVVNTSIRKRNNGIWFAGLGTVMVGLAIFFTAGFNNTPFYPSLVDLESSLSIYNASSSKYTLTVMSYVALAVPFVLGYIVYVWNRMDSKKISAAELAGKSAHDLY